MIVIPMAGLSRRFTAAGFTVPKYMLEAHGLSLFDQAVLSFRRYFETERFLFVAREEPATLDFVAARCRALGLADWCCRALAAPTRGQAETVELGLAAEGVEADEVLTIFNIDTFRPGFGFPYWRHPVDGFLEAFEGEGDNWSFARVEAPGSDRVVETAEKRAISRLCCTGLYQFARASLFRDAYAIEAALPAAKLSGGELYVAPLFNQLVAGGCDVRVSVIGREDVVFCGVPDEYRDVMAAKPIYAHLDERRHDGSGRQVAASPHCGCEGLQPLRRPAAF